MTAVSDGRPPARSPGAGRDQEARRELAALLAGAKDLDGDYDSTIELAEYLKRRRAAGGMAVDVDTVLLDLEASLRSAPPPLLEHVLCGSRLSGGALHDRLERARTEFDRRIREHLAFARTVLEGKRPS